MSLKDHHFSAPAEPVAPLVQVAFMDMADEANDDNADEEEAQHDYVTHDEGAPEEEAHDYVTDDEGAPEINADVNPHDGDDEDDANEGASYAEADDGASYAGNEGVEDADEERAEADDGADEGAQYAEDEEAQPVGNEGAQYANETAYAPLDGTEREPPINTISASAPLIQTVSGLPLISHTARSRIPPTSPASPSWRKEGHSPVCIRIHHDTNERQDRHPKTRKECRSRTDDRICTT